MQQVQEVESEPRQAAEPRHDGAATNDTPFFVVGSGRSGTTLLRLILLGHSRLHVPPESWFLEDLVRELPLTGPLTPSQVARAVDIVTGHRRWNDFGIPIESFREQVSRLAAPTLRTVVDLIYDKQLKLSGKARFGDKTPRYIRIVPQLSTIYPGAKFIHLIRDGRDVAISRIDADWDRYYERRQFRWLEAMDYRDRIRRSSYSAQVLEVRYEDLVRDSKTTVQKICDFLGEPFEEGMLSWQQHVDRTIPARELRFHQRVKGEMDKQNVAVWRNRLSSFECFSMEACMHRQLAALGYDLRFANPLWRPLLDVWGGTLNLLAPPLRRILPALQRRKLLPARLYF